MFKAQNRLKRKKDIDRVHRSKTGVFDSVSGIKWTENQLNVSRFVIAAGTKVSKKAVLRNKLKRQYREHLKELLPTIKPGVDIMIILSKGALELSFEDQFTRLKEVFSKSKLT